jgi:hypothetical protein
LENRILVDWFAQPSIQHLLGAFAAALVSAELFNRLRLSGLAAIAGIAASAYLGHSIPALLPPVSDAERLFVIALSATVLGLSADCAPKLRRPVAALMALIAGALVVWIIWPGAGWERWFAVLAPAGLGIVYAVWTMGTLALMADHPERAGASGVSLGAAVGVCVLLTGTGPLTTLAFAVAAASLAYLIVILLSDTRLPCGASFVFPVGAICAVIPPLAVLKSGMSWMLLPALALVSAAGVIPLSERLSPRARTLLALTVQGAAAAAVAAVAWFVVGPTVK